MNRKTRKFLLLITLLFPFPVSAFNITGTVTDEFEVPITNALVMIEETMQTSFSDADGNFFISNVGFGDYSLIVEADQFLGQCFYFTLKKDKILQIQLKSVVYDLDTVNITAAAYGPIEASAKTVYSEEELNSTPIFSNPFNIVSRDSNIVDLGAISALSLPSCEIASGSQKPLVVDGGDPDWNRYFFGHCELPYSTHITGNMRSVFPIDVVNNINTWRGISPLEYGPGIGGTFSALPDDNIPDESFVKIIPSLDYIDLYSEFKSSESSGIIASLRHSIFQFTHNYGSAKEENVHYYPPITDEMLSAAIPEMNGDLFLKYLHILSEHKISLNLLGFYDTRKIIFGNKCELDNNGDVYSLSFNGSNGFLEDFYYAGIVGLDWQYSPEDSYINNLFFQVSYFSKNRNWDCWDDSTAEFAPYRYSTVSNLLFLLSDELYLYPLDELEITLGAKLRYSLMGGGFQTWEAQYRERTFYFDENDEPYWLTPFDSEYERIDLHYILDENGYPTYAEGEIVPFGEDFIFSQSFNLLLPSLYANVLWELDTLSLCAGAGLHSFIAEEGISFHPAGDAKLSWSINPELNVNLLLGISPGRFNELSLTFRKLNEKYFNIEDETSLIEPPYALTVQSEFDWRLNEELSIGISPWVNWYYNLSGFSVQTNYKESADFLSDPVFLKPLQGLSYGGSIELEYELTEFLFNRFDYTLSWSLYEIEDLGWVAANSDFRHIVKDTLYFEPMDGLTIGVVLSSYIGMAFTPYSVVSIDPLITVSGEFNSARDWVPKWELKTQTKYDFEFMRFECSAFINSTDMLRWIPQKIFGLKDPVSIGDSTAVFQNRVYEDGENIFTSILNFVELGFSARYTF